MRTLFSALLVTLAAGLQSAGGQTTVPALQERYLKPQSVTVRGRALNQDGEPIAGAAIYVLSTNRMRPSNFDPVISHGVTDAKGAYTIGEVQLPILAADGGPIKKHAEGAFQVYGIAKGYG